MSINIINNNCNNSNENSDDKNDNVRQEFMDKLDFYRNCYTWENFLGNFCIEDKEFPEALVNKLRKAQSKFTRYLMEINGPLETQFISGFIDTLTDDEFKKFNEHLKLKTASASTNRETVHCKNIFDLYSNPPHRPLSGDHLTPETLSHIDKLAQHANSIARE